MMDSSSIFELWYHMDTNYISLSIDRETRAFPHLLLYIYVFIFSFLQSNSAFSFGQRAESQYRSNGVWQHGAVLDHHQQRGQLYNIQVLSETLAAELTFSKSEGRAFDFSYE